VVNEIKRLRQQTFFQKVFFVQLRTPFVSILLRAKQNDLGLKPISKNFYQHFPLNFKHFLNFPLDDDLQNKRLGPQTFFINHPSNFSTKHFSTWLAFWWNGSHSALLAPTQQKKPKKKTVNHIAQAQIARFAKTQQQQPQK